MSPSLADLTIRQLQSELKTGNISPVDIVNDVIKSIEDKDSEVGAYLSINSEDAITNAKEADISKPLGGIPVSIKDLINVKGQPCSCGSRILKDSYTSTFDATVIKKLKEAGAIPLGRVNMDEFAMGSSNETSVYGDVVSPWRRLGEDTKLTPGGSSGGMITMSSVMLARKPSLSAAMKDAANLFWRKSRIAAMSPASCAAA